MPLQAGLFSAVSSAFVIDTHTKLETDPNEQSAALLRAILIILNQSAIPNESPAVPPIQEDPPSEIVTATGLMYASLLISLLAAFVAMLGKQWLNRYLRHAGGSMIERCGDRQRKCDGLQKWPFHLFIESLPVMLQMALLLLACGLCRHMWSINSSVAYILIVLTALGLLFYTIIVIVGTSSYKCPFQTPASGTLRSLWEGIGHQVISAPRSTSVTSLHLFQVFLSAALPLWMVVKNSATYTILRSKQAIVLMAQGLAQWVQQSTPHPPSPILLAEIQEDLHIPQEVDHLSQGASPPQEPTPLPIPPLGGTFTSTSESAGPWLGSTALATLEKTNANDVRCVSWILWNITDSEALDAAIQLASTIRWFEDGLDVEPPYNLIISTLKSCIDSTGEIYPGSRNRAYHSAQAVLWIHICAMCVSEEFVLKFPLPTILYSDRSIDQDLRHLLGSHSAHDPLRIIQHLYTIRPGLTSVYFQWTSNVLLHLSWANQGVPGMYPVHQDGGQDIIPFNATLNRLLTSCIFFGWPVKEEVLRIQDKT